MIFLTYFLFPFFYIYLFYDNDRVILTATAGLHQAIMSIDKGDRAA